MTTPAVNNPLDKSRMELLEAERAKERMARAESYADFDQDWKDFLLHIERVWEKSAGGFKDRSYESWREAYTLARKIDPLLKYVKQAYATRKHTLTFQYTVSKVSGGVMIEALPGTQLHIESMTIKSDQCDGASKNGGVKTLDGDTIFDNGMKLMPALRRGVRTNPPTRHMGKLLGKITPLTIAEAALKYYKAFLDRAEQRFNSEGFDAHRLSE